jgi:hypothetical protein
MTLLDVVIANLSLIQYIAAAFTITGYYFIGSRDAKKRARGFEMGVVGNALWIVYAIYGAPIAIWGVVISSLVMFFEGLRGVWNNIDAIDPDLYHYMMQQGLLWREKQKK